jgi:lipopolysaccharide export system protein LptA
MAFLDRNYLVYRWKPFVRVSVHSSTTLTKGKQMITVTNAQIYSIENGTSMAYEITYSNDSVVRTVIASTGWIRMEYKVNGEWKLSGKQYVVKKNKNRQGERMMETVKNFIAA